MTMPFTGPVPTDVRVSVTGASASPWNLKQTFTDNFGLKAIVRGALPGAGTYQVKVQSADTGPYTRAYRFSGLRPGTRNLTFTLTGGGAVPASFKVDAIADAPPCECDSLDVELNRAGFDSNVEARFSFDWTLGCTGGKGACQGTFSIAGDRAARTAGVDLRLPKNAGAFKATPSQGEIKATCTGDCERTELTGGARLFVQAPSGKVFGRDIRVVTVVVERTCKRVLAPKIFRIAFRPDGEVSDRRSDLDGSGIPDGKEKKN
jgi:hypothetical protein